MMLDGDIPLWLKVGYTAVVIGTLPVYAWHKGWQNYLWFSQWGLLGTMFALWLESSLLASFLALAVVVGDLAWFVILLVRLTRTMFSGKQQEVFPNSDGMPGFIKAMSLFHPLLPILLLWMVATLGYDDRALLFQTLLGWMILVASYLLTDPKHNTNFAFGLRGPQRRVHPLVWLAFVCIMLPLLIYMPTHLVLESLWG